MNWTLPQMLPVTKHDPPLKGRWDLSDALMERKRMKERKKKASKGEQGEPIQLSLLVSPQFHFKNLSAHPTLVSSPQPSVGGPETPPINERRAGRSQACGTRWLDTYITSLNFSHTDTSTSGTMTLVGDKPVLVGILCPESNFPNLVSPHVLSCQACFSGLSQKVNYLAGCRGGRRQNTEKILPVRVLLKVFIPLPPSQQTSRGLTA